MSGLGVVSGEESSLSSQPSTDHHARRHQENECSKAIRPASSAKSGQSAANSSWPRTNSGQQSRSARLWALSAADSALKASQRKHCTMNLNSQRNSSLLLTANPPYILHNLCYAVSTLYNDIFWLFCQKTTFLKKVVLVSYAHEDVLTQDN